MLDRWDNFFVMVGSGAAALTGLIFVAMSIKPEVIIQNTTHKNRAINMLSGFTAVFMACSFALIEEALSHLLGRPVDLVETDAVRNPYMRASIDRAREVVYGS